MKKTFPSWLHIKPSCKKDFFSTKAQISSFNINTVCKEAKCPNRFLCFEKKTAAFLALGKCCTRHCRFCDIAYAKKPLPPDKDEPQAIALLAKSLKLKHIVITMVTRDDLLDKGSLHIATIIKKTKILNPNSTIEVLTSDFGGNTKCIDVVLQQNPDIFNHNIETTRSLTPKIRHKARYNQSLKVLHHAKETRESYPTKSKLLIKSGFMVGLGETETEIYQTINNLKEIGCDIITMGQYLRPSKKCVEVKQFIHPKKFKIYEQYGYSIGVKHMYCGPFVRSSFNAEQIFS